MPGRYSDGRIPTTSCIHSTTTAHMRSPWKGELARAMNIASYPLVIAGCAGVLYLLYTGEANRQQEIARKMQNLSPRAANVLTYGVPSQAQLANVDRDDRFEYVIDVDNQGKKEQRLVEACDRAVVLRPFRVESGKIIYLDNLGCQ